VTVVQTTLYTDPVCPWAYSASPALRVLEWRFGEQLAWRLVVIGLRDGVSEAAARAYDPARSLHGHAAFRQRYGMPFGLVPKPRQAATGRGCRAIVAARLLERGSEWRVLRALQLANFTSPLLLDDDELRVLMAHELGHVMSGHALYRTIAAVLALISLGALPMLASLAVLPVRLAFLEWSRKSELSADRAGLLGGQDVAVAQRVDMKMAGGGRGEAFAGQLNVEAFMQQAHEYAASGEGLDVVYKVLSTLALTHPMHTVRAAELQRWVISGDYDRILRGEYVRRGPETAQRPIADDFAAASDYYAAEARAVANQVAEAARRAAERARDAFRNAQKS